MLNTKSTGGIEHITTENPSDYQQLMFSTMLNTPYILALSMAEPQNMTIIPRHLCRGR